MPNLPMWIKRIDQERFDTKAYRSPVYFDGGIWNVEATHIGKGDCYFVLGEDVWLGVKRDGPFYHIGTKGSEVVQRHEKYSGIRF